MQPQIAKQPRCLRAAAALLAVLALTLGCGGGEEAKPESATAGSRGSIKTQPLESDPCAWVTLAEVEQLVGKLDGAPHTIAQEGGTACVYTLPESGTKPAFTLPGTSPQREILTIRIDFSDPMTHEAAYAMTDQLVAQDPGYQAALAAGGPIEKPGMPEGWDYVREGSVFRLGHMAVLIGTYTPRTFTGDQQTDIATKLAAIIRDRVPDLPVSAEHANLGWEGGSPDPCALVTREEAEAVLGKLPIPPYRSHKFTPFAKADGRACSYYRGKHRVLVLTPTWSDGRESFSLASGLTEAITSKTGLGEQSADTLEGPWDQVKGDIDGTLNFLTGDRMLEMKHGMAGIDAAAALRLASLAVKRLKSAP